MNADRHFWNMMRAKWQEDKHLCVGLDIDYAQLDSHLQSEGVYFGLMRAFRAIIDQTHDLACAYKINIAFYAAHGADAVRAMSETMQYIRKHHSAMPIIIDGKRGDIGKTNLFYDKEMFEHFQADACTANPYLGLSELDPLLKREDKGIFILCRTSNEGAAQFQDLTVSSDFGHVPLYVHIARECANYNKHHTIGLVMGATYPEDIRRVRALVDLPFLIPGVGAQSGDISEVVRYGRSSDGHGIIINNSSAIVYAKKPRTQALATDTAIRAAFKNKP